ncbi:hypothetical protein [Agromyces binzhouensis]|uniref:hypothetical protein n=1 Tax=Agromyces binzhouensis TaxID=1817495 RepID=UPI0036349316
MAKASGDGKALALAAAALLLLSGCSGYSSPRFGGGGDEYVPEFEERGQYEEYVPSDEDIQAAIEDAAPSRWTCTYDPTFDGNWHNDVICQNGLSAHRPSLRGWDDFVTEAEILESGREYEAELNAQLENAEPWQPSWAEPGAGSPSWADN